VLFFGWIGRITFIPAALMIGLWLFSQVIDLGEVATVQQGGVAYAAHVAGAVYGGLTAKLFERRGREESAAGPYA
jgi:membrane associated rhomboid family serine protease